MSLVTQVDELRAAVSAIVERRSVRDGGDVDQSPAAARNSGKALYTGNSSGTITITSIKITN